MRIVFVAVVSVALYGCHDAAPSNRVLGEGRTLFLRLERHCGFLELSRVSDFRETLPDNQITDQYGCRLRGNRTLVNLELHGDPQYKLKGYDEVYSGGAMCSIRLGPGPIAAPLDVDWIIDSLDDPLLAARIKNAIGSVDLRSEFRIVVNVDGVHVRYWQEAVGANGRDPYAEILLDGCRYMPDERVERHSSTVRLRFDTDVVEGG